jgi:hypothetical protein
MSPYILHSSITSGVNIPEPPGLNVFHACTEYELYKV